MSEGTPEKSTISLFSGALGLDLGLEMAGLETAVAVEMDSDSCDTIRKNKPQTAVIEGDAREVTTAEILDAGGLQEDDVFLVAGGPPCVTFSSGGNRGSIRDAEGSLFEDYLRVVEQVRPEYFVFENVQNIVTAAIKHRPIEERPGQDWNLSSYSEDSNNGDEDGDVAPLMPEEQSGSAIEVILDAFENLGYTMAFFVLNAADFGVPQHRKRLFIIGSRDGTTLRLPEPTHGPPTIDGFKPRRTLRDAIGDIEGPLDHPDYSEKYERFFSNVPEGGNWKDLPEEMQKEAMGGSYNSGGGRTGYFRRLSWDKPSPTVTKKPNRKSSAFCHPEETRPLAVQEWARIQTFPDDWEFVGGTYSKYRQIGNAVPVLLAKSVGEMILDVHENGNAGTSTAWTSDVSRQKMLDAAKDSIRQFANPHREYKPHVSEIYGPLQTTLS
ncbi:MAG: DNA cytosine methyltransferase [Natrinema limicola]